MVKSSAFFFKTVQDACAREDSAEQNCTHQHDPEHFIRKISQGNKNFIWNSKGKMGL